MKLSNFRALQRRPRFDLDDDAANEHHHFRRQVLPLLFVLACIAALVVAAQITLAVDRIHEQRELRQRVVAWKHEPFTACTTTLWRELHPRTPPCEAPCATIDRTEAC